MILDAGFLISVDRGERAARAVVLADDAPHSLHTSHPVVAQVWRDGSSQARLAAFLKHITVHPFDDGPAVGRLLARSGTSDVVDAHLVVLAAHLDKDILTADPTDLKTISDSLGSSGPTIRPWPGHGTE